MHCYCSCLVSLIICVFGGTGRWILSFRLSLAAMRLVSSERSLVFRESRNQGTQVLVVSLGESQNILLDALVHVHDLFDLSQYLFCDCLISREHRSDSVQDFEGALGLHELLLRIVEVDDEEARESLVNGHDNLLNVVIKSDNRIRLGLAHLATEARVVGALILPNGAVVARPPIDHVEPLHEEDAQVLRLVIGAAVDRWDDALHDLGKYVKHIDFWHSEVNQYLQKLN